MPNAQCPMPVVTPLHVRSGYSLLAGTALPDRLVRRAHDLGYAQLALTDVNGLYGATIFHSLACAAGLRPIIGAELTDGRHSAVALVASETGYENLCRLITRLHRANVPAKKQKFHTATQREEGVFSTSEPCAPLCRMLLELSEGLHLITEDVVLAGDLAGASGGSLRMAADDAAGLGAPEPAMPPGVGRLWLGIDPGTQSPRQVRALCDFSARTGLPLVATGKALVLEEGDLEIAHLLAAIRTGSTYDGLPESQRPQPRAVLRGGAELARELADYPQAVRNNRRLAEECAAFKLLPRKPVFPDFPCPEGLAPQAYLRKLCRQELPRRYVRVPPGAEDRLERELRLIEQLGFSEYFLVVWDIVRYARRSGAPVAGRGSGASSLAAHVLGLTNVCPLSYGIPFERFLHEGRADFPDLDIDFCWRIRDQVIDYAFNRWGKERVAMVCTHNTFQLRSALRETAKAMGLSDAQITQMEEEGDISEEDAEDGTRRQAGDDASRIVRLSRRLLGLPHNLSVHPGGIVIGRKPIDHYVPVQPAPKGVMITQYDKDGVEAVRLVKLDLLGNRNLSTIRCACDLIRRRGGEAPEIEALPPADPATVALLQSGDTVGCNQLESPAMRHLLRMMRPGEVRDVMQALAMIRPGAASIGMKEVFIRRLRGLEPVPPGDERTDAILGPTLGVMLYEDDVMLVAAALTGRPLAEADRFRKAVQKCPDDRRRLELSRAFLARCRANGVDIEYAKDLWVQMAKFNAYSFCRAHAASYALLAYAGAYLKAHHGLEFWTSALNNNQSMYHPRVYVEEAKRRGVRFLPPDVNGSGEEFTVEGGAIRVGLNRVTGLGPAGIAAILRARRRRPFEGLGDFLRRTGLSREEARALILCGAFDWTGRRRPTLMLELELARHICRGPAGRQEVLLSAGPAAPEAPADYSPQRKYDDQRRILGISVGEHVLARRRPVFAGMVDCDSRQLPQRVGRRVRIAGVLEAVRSAPTGNGRSVTFLTLEDEYGLFEVAAFAGACRSGGKGFARYGPWIVHGSVQDQYGAIAVSAGQIMLFRETRGTPALGLANIEFETVAWIPGSASR